MNIATSPFLGCIALCLASAGCKESSASATGTSAVSVQVTHAAVTPPARKLKVTKIAFLDKEHACDCVKKQVNNGWIALEKALAGRTDVAIERMHSDTEEAKVAPYLQLRAMIALPALYFVDEKGGLVEMLQGELTAAQIASALK